MTVSFGFYDSLSGDRKYNAEQFSSLFDGIIADGVFSSVGDGFAVTPDTNMDIIVGSGRAWFNHTWTYNDADIGLTISDADPVFDRIDSVIIEVNQDTTSRTNTIKILTGTPSSTPVPPTLTDSGTLHQYRLANITVGAAVTSIAGGDITSTIGIDTPYCTGVLETVSIEWMYQNWDDQFYNWFDNLVDQLSGSQVTNLQAQIDDLVANNSGYGAKICYNGDYAYYVEPGKKMVNGSILTWSSNIDRSSLTLTASTLYYVYLYDNAGTPDLEESTTAPTWNSTYRYYQKTGDASRRLIGSILANSSAVINQFVSALNGNTLEIYYQGPPYTIISGGSSSSDWTAVDLTGYIPAVAPSHWYALALIDFPSGGEQVTVGVSASDLGSSAKAWNAEYTVRLRGSTAGTSSAFMGRAWLPLLTSLTSYYRIDLVDGSPTASIRVYGYKMDI